MKKFRTIIPLFYQFIKDSESGKRLKKNGEKIKSASIANYRYVLQNLIKYSTDTKFELRICDAGKLNSREFASEKSYWNKFYRKFTEYLYSQGCHDNYVGANVKVIQTFFNYLKHDRDLNTGDFQKLFYVRKEEIEVLVLSPEQLKSLIHNLPFHENLSPAQQRVKDMFVFGCTTGLRYSDILLLTSKNFELVNGEWYLKLKSKKTKVFSYIKLPTYAVDIYHRYAPRSSTSPVFGKQSLFNFNKLLKQIGEIAGFTNAIEVSRERLGKAVSSKKNAAQIRFCDKMSSHMMRRTAITTMLILGMPEHLVRKLSGHGSTSTSFNRYVHYAQSYVDDELGKIHRMLEMPLVDAS